MKLFSLSFLHLICVAKALCLFHKAWCKKKNKKKKIYMTFLTHKFWAKRPAKKTELAHALTDWPVNIWPYCQGSHAPRFDWNLKNGRINLPQCTTTLLALGAPERVTEHTSASRGAVFGYLEVFHSAYPRVLSSKVWVAIKSNIPPHFSVQFKDSISVFHHLFVYVQPIKTT